MYSLEIEEEVFKVFKKLGKKDKRQLEAISKKIGQILTDPTQFKPLRHPLEGLRRVHVGSFVLIYEVCENTKTVKVLKYKHHDEAYL
ncbi:type II toxin-antitoxin system RelE/ParE family toxin [Candidatus Bathyarchaeota archaeon]|nr:type II toxin-antitoxin system RelE/ParE family toxin [Candidatus Bathyarchaeota archaeon]